MKNLHRSLFIISVALLLFACNPSQKAFKKGNYYDATIKAVKQLRNNPESKNALEVIKKSYPMELDYERQQINQLSISNHPDKYMNIVETYTRLNNLADEITRCPAALEVLKPVIYFHNQLQKAEELAISEQFETASKLLERGNYLDARDAVERLEWIKEKNPNFNNLNSRLAEARDLATIKIVVEMKPDLNSNFDVNSKVFYTRLIDFLGKNVANEFTKFYQPDLAQKINVQPQEIVTVQFLEFQIANLVEREKESKYESDSVVVGSYTDDQGKEHNVLGLVKATVNSNERELHARGLLEIKVVDYNSKEILSSQKFPADYFWKNEWATFNGDERAIPSEQLKLTKRKQQIPPSPQEMFLLLSDQIFNNSSQYLKSYYKKSKIN